LPALHEEQIVEPAFAVKSPAAQLKQDDDPEALSGE